MRSGTRPVDSRRNSDQTSAKGGAQLDFNFFFFLRKKYKRQCG